MSGAGPSLHPGDWPARAIFKFPPDAAPLPLPPPWHGEPTFANPFAIPEDLYQSALSYKVPLSIAIVYFVIVTFVNWYNRQHGNKPWRIAKTRLFYAFVIFHNVLLAVYSAITCVAMIRCLKHSFPHYSEPHAVVRTIDALCKIHGPRGLGDAVTYNADKNAWSSRNANILVGDRGLPDTMDVGRIWNEGLAFWGWWFYLSKFYEVLDTAIILAKGKRSTTLQKYHHAGAMLSMWAGMRFMSPPIWMFVLVNSGIHAMMYTYYTVSALGFRVPNVVKRTLTTLQITQFLVGSAFAAVHLFVSYTVPVSIAYKITEKVVPQSTASVATTVSSAVASATESLATALPTVTGVAVAFLRKLIYRAAGDEGLAENIVVPGSPIPTQPSQHDVAAPLEPPRLNPVQKLLHQTVNRTVYRTEYQTVPCVDTSGQAFAIYLNLIYLTPLTILFMRFFFKSYLRRSPPNHKGQPKRRTISDAAGDAKRSLEREFDALDNTAEDGISTAINRARSVVRGRKGNVNGHVKDERHSSLSPANKKFVDNVTSRANQKLQELEESTKATTKNTKRLATDIVDKAQGVKGKVVDSWQDVKQEAGEALENGSQKVDQHADHSPDNTAAAATTTGSAEANSLSTPPNDSPSKKSPKKLRKAENKAKRQAQASANLDLDDAAVAQPEPEPEPKDLKNTLDQEEGKNLL